MYNSKQCFNTLNQLGNVAIQGDHKPEFLLLVADWVETSQNVHHLPEPNKPLML